VIDSINIGCPYCGEVITLALDPSEGDHERIEDCAVCCAPIVVTVAGLDSADPVVIARRDNE